MANPEHLAILKKGATEWNKWREKSLEIPDLSNADLHEVVLMGINLKEANLTGANLSFANLMAADLTWADLTRANLTWANLTATNFNSADLENANLTTATCRSTVFANVDFSRVKGLETVNHYGPSSIDITTFFDSKGKIPEVFLRGAGVPDIFIQYAASLTGAAFEFYSCFISYSNKDNEFVQRLHADLQARGVRCWFAPEDLKIGSKFRTAIDEAINVHDKLLLVLSDHSVQSDWVEKEVETAFERERREKRLVLFPVCLGDALKSVTAGWAADIRRNRHMGDFRNWRDHDAYAKAFERLLRDLKSETADKAKPSPT